MCFCARVCVCVCVCMCVFAKGIYRTRMEGNDDTNSFFCLYQLTGSSERPLKVTQFHFTAWPDHGVPEYATPILAFHKRIMS